MPLPGAVELLQELAGEYRVVGVVSGRPAAFLIERFALADPGSRVRAFGLYGMETVAGGGEIVRSAEALGWSAAVEEAGRLAAHDAPARVRVEPKGLAVTIHYREAPGAADWAAETAGRLAAATGLRAHAGKMSFELRPPVSADKGTVVDSVSHGLSGLCYLGDDVGDLPAFAALDRLGEMAVLTCKVAVGGAEAPPELVTAADLVVDGPAGSVALLRQLAVD